MILPDIRKTTVLNKVTSSQINNYLSRQKDFEWKLIEDVRLETPVPIRIFRWGYTAYDDADLSKDSYEYIVEVFDTDQCVGYKDYPLRVIGCIQDIAQAQDQQPLQVYIDIVGWTPEN